MKKIIYIIIALLFAVAVSKAQTACQAGYTYNVSGLTATFTDASTSSFTIISWTWNFGDSQTSTSQNPSHTYAAGGTYNVCLTITDSHGCHSTTCHSVTAVGPNPCHASFTLTTDSTGMIFYFTNTSTGTTSTTVYTWSFGDFTTSNQENPTHTYTSTGFFMVCLYITDSTTSCHSHYCHPVFTAHHHHHHPHHNHHRQSIFAESNEDDLNIYPNPAADVLNININNDADESSVIRLTDVTGKVIYSLPFQLKTGENNLSIPVMSLNIESGIYFLSVNQNQSVTTRKVVIQ